MHVGQIVELAKQIQIEELKNQLALLFPQKSIVEMFYQGRPDNIDDMCLVNDVYLSKEG